MDNANTITDMAKASIKQINFYHRMDDVRGDIRNRKVTNLYESIAILWIKQFPQIHTAHSLTILCI